METIGYYNYDEHFWALNFVLVNSKYYIYRTAKKNYALNIFSLQRIIEEKFHEQKYLAKINSSSNHFQKRWRIWQYLFTNAY